MDVRLSKLSRTRGMNGRISASRFAAVVVGAVWVLTALGNNWAEFGLPSFVTANRTAYFILFSSIIILAMVGREKTFVIDWAPAVLSISLVVVGMWGMVSAMLSPHPELLRLDRAVSWIIHASVLVAAYIVIRMALAGARDLIVNIVIIAAFVVSLATCVMLLEHVSFANSASGNWRNLRYGFNEQVSVGLNRHLNGLFVLIAFPAAVVLGVVRRTGFLKGMSWFAATSYPFFTILAGSRQNSVGFAVFIVTLLIVASFSSGNKAKYAVYWLRLLVIGGLVGFAIWQLPGVPEWIHRRFIDVTQRELSSGSKRTLIYATALETIASVPFLGLGPGVFARYYGFWPHSGYLGLASQFGLPALFVVLGMTALTHWWAFKRRPRSTRDGSFSFFATVFSCAIVYTVWLNLWNDLLDEAVYWITLALLLGSVARTRS